MRAGSLVQWKVCRLIFHRSDRIISPLYPPHINTSGGRKSEIFFIKQHVRQVCPGKAVWNTPYHLSPAHSCDTGGQQDILRWQWQIKLIECLVFKSSIQHKKGWMTNLFFHEAWWRFPPSNLSPSYTRESDKDTQKLVTNCFFCQIFHRSSSVLTLSRGYDVQEVPPPKIYILCPSWASSCLYL